MPMLLAAGSVALERATRDRRGWRYAAAGLLVAGALPIVPMGLPLLRVESYVAYVAALGAKPTNQERQELGALPQHFADMHGWEKLARTISSVYQALPAEERASARVWAQNYGEAGALEYFCVALPAAAGDLTAQQLLVLGSRPRGRHAHRHRRAARRHGGGLRAGGGGCAYGVPLLHALREQSSHTHRTSLESAADRRVEQGEGVHLAQPGDFVPRTPLHARSRGPRRPAPLAWLARCRSFALFACEIGSS